METMAVGQQEPAKTVLPDHLSWSALGTYSGCSKRYFYRYIDHAPDERKASSLVFGGAVHKAIEAFHEARMVGNAIPSTEEMLAPYDAAWQEAERQGTPIAFGASETAASLRELAGRMLTAYRSQAGGGNGQVVGIEHAVRFRVVPDAPPLEARLDLVELIGKDLVVTDFKTSRSRWNDAKAAESLPQLVAYCLSSLPLMMELGATRIVPKFVVITKGKSPQVQVVEPKATQDDVAKFRQTVSETWKAIEAGVFVRREGWQCKGCPFHERCQGSGALNGKGPDTKA